MPASLPIPPSLLFGFLLVLARVAGALVFVPIPGVQRGPEMARVVISVAVTLALFSLWPVAVDAPDPGRLAGWLLFEAALGVMVGLAVSFLTEALVMAAQVVGLPAGFAYASMVDPQTQADSGVLLVFAQLSAGLLFFAAGLDREVLRIFARSLESLPPGAAVLPASAGEALIRLGAGIFTVGFRLALPAVALLMLVDIALALVGRVHAQLQLLTISFPVKMLAAVAVLAWTLTLFPRLYVGYAGRAFGVLRELIR